MSVNVYTTNSTAQPIYDLSHLRDKQEHDHPLVQVLVVLVHSERHNHPNLKQISIIQNIIEIFSDLV